MSDLLAAMFLANLNPTPENIQAVRDRPDYQQFQASLAAISDILAAAGYTGDTPPQPAYYRRRWHHPGWRPSSGYLLKRKAHMHQAAPQEQG